MRLHWWSSAARRLLVVVGRCHGWWLIRPTAKTRRLPRRRPPLSSLYHADVGRHTISINLFSLTRTYTLQCARSFYISMPNLNSLHLQLRPTQPPTLCGPAKSGWGVKAVTAHSTCGYICGWPVKLCHSSLTRAIP